MTTDALQLIADSLKEAGINYEYMEWTSEPVYPYFVGEYQEMQPLSEDRLQESVFILTGFSRTSWFDLEKAKETIENIFNKISGKTAISVNGNGVAVLYSNSNVISTGDAELKKIQINLTVKEWKVNE